MNLTPKSNLSNLFPNQNYEIIQGGMGVAISDYNLAGAVAKEGAMGIVSGTAIGVVLARRLQDGDVSGEVREAMSHFPNQDTVATLLKMYYLKDGIRPDGSKKYKPTSMFTHNTNKIAADLAVVGSFVEVWLAKNKAGGNGAVGMNLLTKIQEPTVHSLYGAMLAGVDIIAMGAGVPNKIPAVLAKLSLNELVEYDLHVAKAKKDDRYAIKLDPAKYNPENKELKIPKFLAIVSKEDLAEGLKKNEFGPDGFIIEGPIAGGHNAPARGYAKDDKGQPVYSEQDAPDLDIFNELGLPYWLAGGYGGKEGLARAKALGAFGIQAGSVFALAEESGLDEDLKNKIIKVIENGDDIEVFTSTKVSPTGFPFKVAMLEATLSDPDIYKSRERICDIGFLRQSIAEDDGKITYRCPAEPESSYSKKVNNNKILLDKQIGAVCLCNGLLATAGYPQERDGIIEPPIVTLGDDAVNAVKSIGLPLTAKRIIDSLKDY